MESSFRVGLTSIFQLHLLFSTSPLTKAIGEKKQDSSLLFLYPVINLYWIGYKCAKPDMRNPTQLSAKVLISKINSLFHINSAIFTMSTVFMVRELLPDQTIEYNNIEEFLQKASGKPDPDPVRIWACVPIHNLTQIFSVDSSPTVYMSSVIFPKQMHLQFSYCRVYQEPLQ